MLSAPVLNTPELSSLSGGSTPRAASSTSLHMFVGAWTSRSANSATGRSAQWVSDAPMATSPPARPGMIEVGRYRGRVARSHSRGRLTPSSLDRVRLSASCGVDPMSSPLPYGCRLLGHHVALLEPGQGRLAAERHPATAAHGHAHVAGQVLEGARHAATLGRERHR